MRDRLSQLTSRTATMFARVDALLLLIGLQTLFLLYGVLRLDFSVSWYDIAAAVATAVATEFLFGNVPLFRGNTNAPRSSAPKSALAAALGICIFFRAVSPWYFALAAFLAIASKYAIRIKGRHIFNPSNFGIVTLVFLLPYATTIEFTQWQSDRTLFAVIATICFLVAYRAGVIVTTFSFLLSYAMLLSVFLSIDPVRFSIHHYGLLGPSLVLFACFMITDPRTSPTTFWGRILHGIAVAALYFVLETAGLRYALFAASFLISILNQISARIPFPFFRGKSVPSNWATCVFAVVACSVTFTGLALSLGFQTAPYRISAQFMLFGVESSTVQRCTADPIFVPDTSAGFPGEPSTDGAAWGDYNGDGFDDIFVSNSDQPSQLYENEHGHGFVQVTTESGLPPIYASSAMFVDYDNNGTLDLIVLESKWSVVGAISRALVVPRVFKNTGGKFVEVTDAVGLAGVELQQGAGSLSFADYNGDGTLDMLIATVGTSYFLDDPEYRPMQKIRNDPLFRAKPTYLTCGEKNIRTELDAFGPSFSPAMESTIQGRLSSPTSDIPCIGFTDMMPLLAYAPPYLNPSPSHMSTFWFEDPGSIYLFENKGGKFIMNKDFTDTVRSLRTNVTNYVNVSTLKGSNDGFFSGRFYQPVSFDFDGDGKPDILLAIDLGHDLLLKNMGNFVFKDITTQAGITTQGSGMGVDVSDWNGDGLLDVVVTNVLNTYLYENTGGGVFVNKFKDLHLQTVGNGWGISFLDYDLDGWQDLFVSNGIIETNNSRSVTVPLNRPLFRTDALYKNEGGKSFLNTTSVDFCPRIENGYVLAVSDFDNDGDPDVFDGTEGSGDVLYKDAISHTDLHYLKIKLQGSTSNRMGVGAVVHVISGTRTQTKPLLLGNSFRSENSTTLLFGLSTSTAPVSVRVEWPSGIVSDLSGIPVDHTITVREGAQKALY